MKKLVEKQVLTQEMVDEDGGLITLLGKRAFFHCMNYNYAGIVIGVNQTTLELSEPKVVFETGAYTNSTWKDAQEIPPPASGVPAKLIINIASIEACWPSEK